MKRAVLFIGLVFLALPLFCEVVKSDVLTSRYGVSHAERQGANYIEKGGYSFRYLGNGTWDVKSMSSNSSDNNSTGSPNPKAVLFYAIIGIVHIILTFCVSKMKGPYYACFYFFLAPVALLGLLLFFERIGTKPNPNKIVVTHRHQY